MRRAWTVVTCVVAAAILLATSTSTAGATSARGTARPATSASGNLIVDPDAEAGHCTTDWHAATTVPGWTVLANSPNIMCYSAGTFGTPASPSPGAAFFAPGDQGDPVLAQTVDVSSAATAIDGGGVTFDLSAWLGGWTSYAGTVQVSVDFRDSAANQLGSPVAMPTVTAADRHDQTGFLARATTGSVPAGARSVVVRMTFANTSGESGYADNLSLTLTTPVTAPVLAPPPSSVPGYDHVFMVMMENTNYSAIVPDTTGMPYLHGLMAQGTSMSDYHAVYHPSDENYLAVAGGDTYASGAIYWPNIHDPGTNIADELEAQGKSWKAYEQGMGVPCNVNSSTEHTYDSYYAPDDAPFINYTDVSSNSARCKAH
ncbi:MAG TPA: alkaline phosphatase family protein, partial [Pseudonocardiaceae bacterium]|nr:alkaline phosphatase family protein [Pseudonocardiaceae bacterium]